jgi:hypothetical protein
MNAACRRAGYLRRHSRYSRAFLHDVVAAKISRAAQPSEKVDPPERRLVGRVGTRRAARKTGARANHSRRLEAARQVQRNNFAID